jgi:hypothetical protein
MLGELLFEIKGRLTGSRIINVDEYKIEHSIIEEGKFRDIEITILGTFLTISTTIDKNETYVEGHGIINTKNGQDTATFIGYGIGRTKGQISGSFRGSVFWKSSSANGKLSSLNNKVGVFETKWLSLEILLKRFGNGNNNDNDSTIQ